MDRQPLVLAPLASASARNNRRASINCGRNGSPGEASADLQARTREIAEKVTDRAAHLADGVTAAITNEAQAQGLTAERLKQTTSGANRKVQHIVAQSTERLRSAT